ncbi:hypothetical protein A1Q2_00629 [Trichosporon asahii var. asahii CBS 8904]|uniref:Uncharacterized protein n=1 Tax=Trichosporon asahii var. asahii (strain CBS 8904) TaxID=1220162 RepID=K1VLP4_TRIAC|nr:hypothetical protein A1Q2_00629 [Trichosporon asahii var. asahii CBS 8904]
MAPLRPCRYSDPGSPLRELKPDLQLSRAAKLNLEDNIRQRKAHSKRDMAKFAKEVSSQRERTRGTRGTRAKRVREELRVLRVCERCKNSAPTPPSSPSHPSSSA